ncbi:hypothetical protein V8C86DRAFT_2482219, partial [Haematococcus lacustris]
MPALAAWLRYDGCLPCAWSWMLRLVLRLVPASQPSTSLAWPGPALPALPGLPWPKGSALPLILQPRASHACSICWQNSYKLLP